jgi:MFS family permease
MLIETPNKNQTLDNGTAQSTKAVSMVYTVGTLKYTLFGLVTLFAWLLWGDFCYMLLETVVQRLFPIILKNAKASNTLMSVMVSSVPSILNLTLIPVLCTRSDGSRTVLGRRRPFLLVAAPVTTLFFIPIAYSDVIGGYLHRSVLGNVLSETVLILAVLCLLIVLFQIFNSFMMVMYNCLLADVVPQAVIGRFLACFRTVSTLASFVFSRYIFGLSGSYMREIFIGIGIVYLLSFLLMCIGVKEGQYPPIEKAVDKNRFSPKEYVKQCFTIRHYLFICMMAAMFMIAFGCTGPFVFFFQRDTLGLSLDEIGKYFGWIYILQAVAAIPLGYLCDKIKAVRLNPICILALALIQLLSFFFIKDLKTMYIYGLLAAIPNSGYYISQMALAVEMFPKLKFAQYSSAIQVLCALGLIAGNMCIGLTVDYFGNRSIYLWLSLFCFIAVFFGSLVYRGWKSNGGPANYLPPQ